MLISVKYEKFHLLKIIEIPMVHKMIPVICIYFVNSLE